MPPGGDWPWWGLVAGRGFGKTRAGAEFVRRQVNNGARSIALIGETPASCRDLMVDGQEGSSILEVFPPYRRPEYRPGLKKVYFHTGAEADIFSSWKPDALRGWQGDTFWGDEIANWKKPQNTWDMLMFGFRSPDKDLRGCFTTTPKPIDLLEDLLEDPDVPISRGTTYDNRANLHPKFFEQIIKRYEGTELGEQELKGRLLTEREGALWDRDMIEGVEDEERQIPGRVNAARLQKIDLTRIVVAIDPAATSKSSSDETGIVVAGKGPCECQGRPEPHGFVLADLTGRYSPHGWATKALDAYEEVSADRIIGERNNGGEMVEHTIRSVDGGEHASYKSVWASRGKQTRAEPVSALYEQGKVHHVGVHEDLETQMVTWDPDEDSDSPDRVDALVWAMADLFPLRKRAPEPTEPVHY